MKLKLIFIFSLLMPWFLFNCGIDGKSLKVNIIGHCAGKGLMLDKAILSKNLKSLGYKVCVLEGIEETAPDAHINIFIEHVSPQLFAFAKQNWFIPNPEWFFVSNADFSNIDLIVCRTKEVQRIFAKKNKNTYYLGFTTPEAKISGIVKDFTSWVHIAGNSPQKGTSCVVRTWLCNKSFPHTTIVRWTPSLLQAVEVPNLTWISDCLPYEHIRMLQNQSGIHLCLSETEGFGHYLMEAMSCEAVILTTDAPPMNEFITDKRCLIPYDSTSKQRLATNYYVSDDALQIYVRKILSLSEEELIAIGKKNRANFLRIKRDFRIRLKKLMESAEKQQSYNLQKGRSQREQ